MLVKNYAIPTKYGTVDEVELFNCSTAELTPLRNRNSSAAGFEPARAEPTRFQVVRCRIKNIIFNINKT
ncbi:hypothetical protein H8356DRAFT_1357356 [Neocallimastix lanati (nom. inval.)]|nr:hypothetical protein H8356DRAFT_1357356 [Neocallimastix sp. JGI-2020a]